MALMHTATVADTSEASAAPQSTSLEREARQARDHRRRRSRFVRRVSWSVLLAAAGIGAVVALRPKPAPVDVAIAERGPLVVAIEEDGMTRIRDRYNVSAPISGNLSRILLEAGDAVEQGDIVATIAPAQAPLLDERSRAEAQARLRAALSALGQARAQARRASSATELAERDLARDRTLAASGSISPQAFENTAFQARMRSEELDSATFGVHVAEEEVRRAQVILNRSGDSPASAEGVDVTAPVPGSVLRVVQQSAGLVGAGTPLLEIGDSTALEVVVDLLTTDAVQVEPGTQAEIVGWGSDRVLHGEVTRIEPSAFTKLSALGVDEQRVNVVIALTDPRPQWLALGDGYRVQARIVLWRAEQVLKVPMGALFRHGDSWAVFRIEDGSAHLAHVELGQRGETEAEIAGGLSIGSVVAVHPGDRVKDGARVEVQD